MVTFAAWSGQNPPFKHHKNEATEEIGTESARAKQMQKLHNTNNNITKQGIAERKSCHKSFRWQRTELSQLIFGHIKTKQHL